MGDLAIGNFCLKGYIDVPADRVNSISEALEEHVNLTRKEMGCLYFHVDPCPDVTGRFLVSEAFVDEAAFAAHQERAANSAWATVTDGIKRNYKTWLVE